MAAINEYNPRKPNFFLKKVVTATQRYNYKFDRCRTPEPYRNIQIDLFLPNGTEGNPTHSRQKVPSGPSSQRPHRRSCAGGGPRTWNRWGTWWAVGTNGGRAAGGGHPTVPSISILILNINSKKSMQVNWKYTNLVWRLISPPFIFIYCDHISVHNCPRSSQNIRVCLKRLESGE